MSREGAGFVPFQSLVSLPQHDMLLGPNGANLISHERVYNDGVASPRPSGPVLLAAIRRDVEDLLLKAMPVPPNSLTFATFKALWSQADFSLVYALGFTHLSTKDIVDTVYQSILDNLRACMDFDLMVDRKLDACLFFLYFFHQSQPLEQDSQHQHHGVPYPIYIAPEVFAFLINWRQQFPGRTSALPDSARCLSILFKKKAFVTEIGAATQVMKPKNLPFDSQNSVRDLQIQLAKIEEAMVRDCIPALHLHELSLICDQYDSLRIEAPPGIPFLSETNFHWTIQTTLARGQQPPVNLLLPQKRTAGGRRRNTVMGSVDSAGPHTHTTHGRAPATRRKSSMGRVIPPSRPMTAPPHIPPPTAGRQTPPTPIHEAMDMPDLSNFLNT